VSVAALSSLGCANATREPFETKSATDEPTASAGAGEAGAGEGGAMEHAIENPPSAWCTVRVVLETKCQRCHGVEPENGAPFSLVSYEDTQVENRSGRPRFEAIETAVAGDYMPPSFIMLDPPVEPLSESERELLLGWCASGAPNDSEGECPVP
jgi:hypothetical protein